LDPVSSILITNVRVIDGTGAPAFDGGVRMDGGRIAGVGDLDLLPGEMTIDGGGHVLAPGFIDSHSHAARALAEHPEALGAVTQGITTVVVGPDGSSELPVSELFDRLDAAPVAVNVASFTGHASLRRQVMGDEYRRPANEADLEAMAELLRADLASGSLGLSTGLEYEVGRWASTEEVIALARVAGEAGGRYTSHMRSEDRALFEALEELIRIGREASIPVQATHLKLAMRSLWGRADEVLAILDEARAEGVDVTADVYPYEYWQSTMTVLFPDREYTTEVATFALEELAPPEGMIIGTYSPDASIEGKTLAQVAEERGEDVVATYLSLIDGVHGPDAPEGARESIVARSMIAEDIGTLLQWNHTNVCTDGELDGPHPRGFGSFTRVLGRFVREDAVLSLEEAVHKMTGLTAAQTGITDRGVVAPGAAADLVLFDPATVRDRATFESPNEPSVGIDRVWVNGVEVWDGTATTGLRPGEVVRRGGR
jgi:N-acyl-D-amino-acid deacylase